MSVKGCKAGAWGNGFPYYVLLYVDEKHPGL